MKLTHHNGLEQSVPVTQEFHYKVREINLDSKDLYVLSLMSRDKLQHTINRLISKVLRPAELVQADHEALLSHRDDTDFAGGW